MFSLSTDPIPIMTSNNEHETLYPNYYFCKSLKHWAGIAWSTAEDDVPGLGNFQNQIAKDLDVDPSQQKISIIAIEDNMRSRQVRTEYRVSQKKVPNFENS